MNDKIEEQFPWVSIIKRGFLKSFSDDYDIGTLELLQENIEEELQRVKPKSNLKIAKRLFECIKDFYYHFCRKWYQRKKFSPPMEVAWVHILTSFIKISLLLSRGNKESKWIHQVLAAIMRFQGKNNLIYDALLSIHSLNKKYQYAYGAVLMHLLIYIPTFVPVIIDDPAEYLKVALLVRRLKFLIKDPVEKAELRMKTSKILAPPNLLIWLLERDFNATWMNSVCKINLGINICRKLKGKGSENEVVETLRKILLPGISTEGGTEQAIKRKVQKRKKCASVSKNDLFPSKSDEHMNTDGSEMKKSTEKIEGIVVSEKNAFEANFQVNVFDNTKLVSNKKSKKGKGENMQFEIKQDDLPYQECSSKSAKKVNKQKSQQLDKVAEKRAHKISQNSIDSCLLKDMKQCSCDEVHCMHQSDEPKRKKRKRRGEVLIAAEKNPEIIKEAHNNHSLPKNISHSEITKNRRKKQKSNKLDINTKEIEFITVNSNSDAEDSPVIIDEINASESFPNEKSRLSKCRNVDSSFSSSDNNEPVIVTEIKHYSPFGPNSSHEKKNKPIKTKLKPNTGTAIKITTESVNPSNYESAADQIAYDTVNDAIQKNQSICIKPENIIDKEEDLNSLIDSVDLLNEVPFVESNLRLKIAEKCHTSEEILNSCASNTSPIRNDQQNLTSKLNITDKCFISEEKKSIPTGNQTKVNNKNKKHEDEIQDSCPDSISESNITDKSFISEEKKSISTDNQTNINVNDQHKKHDDEIQDSCSDSSSESNIADKCVISVEKRCMTTGNQTNINVHGQNCKCDDEIRDPCPDFPSPMKKGPQEVLSEANFANECLVSVKETNIFPEKQVDVNMNDQNCENVDLGKVVSSSMEGHSDCINETVEEFSQDTTKQIDIIDHSRNQTPEFVENCKNLKSVQNSEKYTDKSKEFPMQTDLKQEKLDINISHEAVPRLESNSSSLNDENCIQETEKQKGDSESFATDKFTSGTNNVSFPEMHFVNTEITKNNSKIFVENKISENEPLSFVVQKEKITQNDRLSESSVEKKLSSQEIKIKDAKLISDSNLSNKIDSKIIYNSDSNSSVEIDNTEVVKDDTCINTQSPSQNSLINDLPKYQITGLFFDAKSPILKTDVVLSEDSQILDDRMKQKLNGEINNVEIKTPCRCAASDLMESMLKLVEQASSVKDESTRQNILKGDLTSTLNSLSATSSPSNEKSVKCLSFLDISSENVNNLCETPSFACLAPKGSEFLQYREIFHDQEDNRSEDTLSENKSILKADASEYFSDASNETESDESNFSPRDCNSPVSFDAITESSNSKNNYDMNFGKTEFSLENTVERHLPHKEEDENDVKKLQDSKTIVSAKNILPEGSLLNPVVYLGKKCDSKSFICANSTESADFLDATTNSSVPPDFGDGDEGINEKKPSILCSKHVQTTSEVSKSFEPINEISIKSEVIEDVPFDIDAPFTQKYIKTSEVQSKQNDLKERCLTTDKKLSVSERDQESIELVCEKRLSQDQGSTECDKDRQSINYNKESVQLAREIKVSPDQENTECDKDQELTVTKKGRESEPSLSMKLRKRHVPLAQKFVDTEESCNVSNQNTTATRCMTLRSRNPPASPSRDVRRRKSQIISKRSSKKLKTETSLNLDFDFSELCLNSPKTLRTKIKDSSNKSNSAVVEDSAESPTSGQGNLCEILTPASIISSNDTGIKKQDTDPEGYNLRSRKSVIMPGKLKL